MTLKDRLTVALEQCLQFIEHSEANRGKLADDAQWEENVERFQTVSMVQIGRTAVPKASVNLNTERS